MVNESEDDDLIFGGKGDDSFRPLAGKWSMKDENPQANSTVNSFRPLAGKWSMKVFSLGTIVIALVSVPLRGNGQ